MKTNWLLRTPRYVHTAALALGLIAFASACSDEVALGDDTGGGRSRARDVGGTDRGGDTGATDSARDRGGLDVPSGADTFGLPDFDGPAAERVQVVVPGAESFPAQFEGSTVFDREGPELVYPLDGAVMPRNVSAATFQWEGGENEAYRLTLRNAALEVVVYTRTWSWTPAPALWEQIASNGGGELAVWVERYDGVGRHVGQPSGLGFSAAAVQGALYYWAPLSSGIVRLEVGAEAPEDFLTGDVFRCVGCHGLSPDGSRLAYTRSSGGTPIGNLGVIGTDDARYEYMAPSSLAAYYPSFGPDNVRLAATRGQEIVIINSDTGLVEEALPRPGSAAANYAAWSPRGDAIAFSAGTGDPLGGLGISDAGIARVRLVDDEWSAAEWLTRPGDAGGGAENFFYPAFSPDGRWLVFNRALEAAAVGASPAGSELWVISNERGGPVRLDNANGPAGTTNSWPKWAPESADGMLWVAFTSSRPYGRLHEGQAQIWIAALDPERAARGEDPSAAPFWMPHQSLGETNHVAYWAEFTKEE